MTLQFTEEIVTCSVSAAQLADEKLHGWFINAVRLTCPEAGACGRAPCVVLQPRRAGGLSELVQSDSAVWAGERRQSGVWAVCRGSTGIPPA